VYIAGPELEGDEIGITLITPTAGLKEKKQMDLTKMIQALAPMTGFIGADIIMELIAEQAEVMDMRKLQLRLMNAAEEIKQAEGQMTPEQQLQLQMAQVEMAKNMADAQAKTAKSDLDSAKADTERMKILTGQI